MSQPELITPEPATKVDVSKIPATRFEVEPTELSDGEPSAVPWAEIEGSPVYGSVRFIHVGAREVPIRTARYIQEIGVWRNGVVWSQDTGLVFAGWDGNLVKLKGVPSSYRRVLFARTKAYALKRGTVISVAAGNLTPKTELHVADLAGVDRGDPTLRSSLRGLLNFDDPVLRAS